MKQATRVNESRSLIISVNVPPTELNLLSSFAALKSSESGPPDVCTCLMIHLSVFFLVWNRRRQCQPCIENRGIKQKIRDTLACHGGTILQSYNY